MRGGGSEEQEREGAREEVEQIAAAGELINAIDIVLKTIVCDSQSNRGGGHA